MALHQSLIGMCGCFHYLTFVWKYLFCFRVEIWASSQRALVLCNHRLPAEEFRLKKISPHPGEQNRAPNWKPSYECCSIPLPPQHYLFIASFVSSTSDAPAFLALNKNNPCFPAVSMKTSSQSMSTKWEPRSLCVLWKAGIFRGTKLIPHIFKVRGTDLNCSCHSG